LPLVSKRKYRPDRAISFVNNARAVKKRAQMIRKKKIFIRNVKVFLGVLCINYSV